MDRLTGMAVFVTAVDRGSLTAAARHHGLSSSMAGKYVAAFEAELGVRLLRRTTRSLSLTEAGAAFHARCRRILDEFAQAQAEASEVGGVLTGPLRVSAPLLYGTVRLSAPLARFAALHPGIVLDLQLGEAYEDITTGGFDLAIRIGNLVDSTIVSRRLETCPMLLCGSPLLVGDGTTYDDIDAIRSLPRLVFSAAVSRDDWTLRDASNRSERIDGPIRMSANNMTALAEAAAAGLGIVYGPRFCFDQRLADGTLRPLLTSYRANDLMVQAIYAPQPPHTPLPAKARALIAYLAAALTAGTRDEGTARSRSHS